MTLGTGTPPDSTDRNIRRVAAAALAVTLAAFLGLGAIAAGWTDSWSQDLAMLGVIVVMGLSGASVLLNLGVLVASVVRGLRHEVEPMKPVYLYLVVAALGYAAVAAVVAFS